MSEGKIKKAHVALEIVKKSPDITLPGFIAAFKKATGLDINKNYAGVLRTNSRRLVMKDQKPTAGKPVKVTPQKPLTTGKPVKVTQPETKAGSNPLVESAKKAMAKKAGPEDTIVVEVLALRLRYTRQQIVQALNKLDSI